MRPSVFGRPTDRPPRQEDWGAGATMSFIAHAVLVVALVWGVHWHSDPTPVGTSAELWAAVPQIAAPQPTAPVEPPPPPEPKPTPVEPPPPPTVQAPKPPDIVTEQEKQKKAREEQEKKDAAEKAAAQKAAEDKAKADAEKQKQQDAQRMAKLRQDQLARINSQLGGGPPDSTGNAAKNAGPSANYLGRIAAILKRNLTQIDPVPGNPAVEVEIRTAPDGTILSWRVTKVSGSQAWDDSVLRAIEKTGRLPVDTDGKAPAVIPLRWRQSDTQ
jgi:colicin import membrane protein